MSAENWTEITEAVRAGNFDASGLANRQFKAVIAYGVEITWWPDEFGGGSKECDLRDLLYSNMPSIFASKVLDYADSSLVKVFVEGELPKPLASTLPAGTHLLGRLGWRQCDTRFIRVDIDGEQFCQGVSHVRATGLFAANDVTVITNMGHSFTR